MEYFKFLFSITTGNNSADDEDITEQSHPPYNLSRLIHITGTIDICLPSSLQTPEVPS